MNRRQVNLKFVLALMAAVTGLGVAVHFVHGFQVKRQADALKQRALDAEADKDIPQATQYLERYLGFRPDDTDAMETFGRLLDQQGTATKSPRMRKRAFGILEEVLRREPDRHAVRRRQVDLALDMGDFGTAVAHAETLLDKDKGDPELRDEAHAAARAGLYQRIGIAEEARKQYDKAAQAYLDAIAEPLADAPEQVECFVRLAKLRRTRLNAPQLADDTMKNMITSYKDVLGEEKGKEVLFRAYLTRAYYWISYFPTETDAKKRQELENLAAADVKAVKSRAAKGTAQETEGYLVDAELAHARQDPAAEMAILQEGVKATKGRKDTRLCLALARLVAVGGDAEEALKVVQEAAKDAPEEPDLLHAEAELLMVRGKQDEVEPIIAKLRQLNYPRTLVDYLDARLHILREQWGDAAQLLARARPNLAASNARLLAPCSFLLGQCFERLGNPEQAVVAYQDAIQADPAFAPARLAKVSALQGLGRLPDALVEAKDAMALGNRSPEVRLLAARLTTAINLRRPPSDKPDWKEVHSQLDSIERQIKQMTEAPGKNVKPPDLTSVRTDLVLLRLNVQLVEDPTQVGKVRESLQKELAAQPGQVEFAVALAGLVARDGNNPEQAAKKNAEALQILQDAEKALAQETGAAKRDARRADLHLARLAYLTRLPEKEARQALADEEKVAEGWADEPRSRLLSGLAEAYLRVGAQDDGERLLKRVVKDRPNALAPRLVLVDLLSKGNDDAAEREALVDLKRLEGDLGTYWRYGEAARLVRQARKESKEGHAAAAKPLLNEARNYLDDLAQRRKSWYLVPTLQGDIADLDGKPDVATERYQQAVALGDYHPLVIRRLVEHLRDQKRWDDLDKLLTTLRGKEETLVLAGFGQVASLQLFRQGDKARALEIALKSIPSDSKRYADHIFLGQLYAQQPDQESKKKAEEEFKKACELASKDGPGAPDPWVVRVSYLATTGRKADALALIEEVRTKVAADRVALALAKCYLAVEDMERADAQFQAALKAQPNDREVLREVASHFLAVRQPAKAEPLLRKLKVILDAEPAAAPADRAWVRRTLAGVLGSEWNEAKFEEAQNLLKENLKANPASLPDLHVQARLLSGHISQRKKAIQLLEDLDKQSKEGLTPEERLTLFRLYDADGDWSKAQAAMLILLNSEPGRRDLNVRVMYVRRLIERNLLGEAEQQLKAVGDIKDPKNPKLAPAVALATREIQARVLHARGKEREALAALKQYAGTKDMDVLTAAVLFDEFARTTKKEADKDRKAYRKEAEDLYRKFVQQSPSPRRRLVLAGFLGTDPTRVDEALRLCEEASLDKAPPEAVAAVMAGVLRGSGQPPTREQCDRVDRWFSEQLAKSPDSDALLVSWADVRDLQEEYPKAEELYEKALAKNPKNLLAINNLAWLKAVEEQKDKAVKEKKNKEALELVSKAIELVGKSPELLDTRGVIYLHLGQNREAVKDLKECVDLTPSAVRYFHLAQAQWAVKNREEAAQAMRKARENGLQADRHLHRLEKGDYDDLRKAVGDG